MSGVRSSAGRSIVCELGVRLEDVEPDVWRHVLVPGTARLSKIADILLIAMGWNNSHLHQFLIGDSCFGMHADDWDEDEIDEATVTLLQAVADAREFVFEYDFGDRWEHVVDVRSIGETDHALKFAVCAGGACACPPDDVGGPDGYRHFLEAIGDPQHPEHADYLEWAGGPFDRSSFDLASVNAELQRLR